MPSITTKSKTHAACRALRIAILAVGSGVAAGMGLGACRPGDVLSVPPPAGVTPASVYQNLSGAEALFNHGKAVVFQGLVEGSTEGSSGLLQWSGLLADEFTWTNFAFRTFDANIDARMTVGTSGFAESGDQAIARLINGRITLLSAIPGLEQFEPANGRVKIGETYALVGYAELLAAEDYCAGVPLATLLPVQGVQYGTPLTTDSLLGVAEADFDSAAAYANGDPMIGALAAVGLARTRLNRGQFVTAAAAVAAVPTSFVYNTEIQPGGASNNGTQLYNWYGYQLANGCGFVNPGDGKGGNGLDFLSAHDPRLVLSAAVDETCDGTHGRTDSVWYYPAKFGNPSTFIPLATGVEARLIEAEAALRGNQLGAWARDLNALRAAAPTSYLALGAPMDSLPADSTTGASAASQVDVMFRERAFWLYGTGTRLGDLRRLIRQYGRDQSTVFPTGPYPHGQDPGLPTPLPNYGTDVNLTLPTGAGGLTDPNPAYKGCLTSTKVA